MKNVIMFIIALLCFGCEERISENAKKIPGNKVDISGKECEVLKLQITEGPMLYVLDCKDKISTDYAYRSGKQTYHISTTQQHTAPVQSVQNMHTPPEITTVTPSSSKQVTVTTSAPEPTQFNFKNCKLNGDILTCTK